jgi:virulence-associated protein VapD
VQSRYDNLEDLYQQALSRASMAKNLDNTKFAMFQSALYPNYIETDSLEAKRWMQTHERAQLVSNTLSNVQFFHVKPQVPLNWITLCRKSH